MHGHTRLNAKAESKILFYIPSADAPSVCLSREHYDEKAWLAFQATVIKGDAQQDTRLRDARNWYDCAHD